MFLNVNKRILKVTWSEIRPVKPVKFPEDRGDVEKAGGS